MSYLKVALAALTIVTVLSAHADAVPPGSDDDIRARLEPFGSVCRAGEDCGTVAATAAGGPKSGEEVYNQFCFACHATGASGAPLFADSEAWAPRVDKGMETLMASTLNGLNMMPPKGTCMGCSDDELEAAVTYMLDNLQ
ncbi:MAG: cytochrome c5 family protein [Pseudomonadales bacterium]